MGEGEAIAGMFSDLIIGYLFLGGVGGGAVLLLGATEVLARWRGDGWRYLHEACMRPVLVIAFGALLVGCACLLKDTARSDQALLLFARPSFSPLSLGAFSLTGLMVCLTVILAAQYQRSLRRCTLLLGVVKAVAAVLAAVVVAYTGFFLFGMASVPLWNTPLIPVLFVLSSLSSGVAVVLMVVSCLVPFPKAVASQMMALVRFDGALIVLEVLSLGLMYLQLRGNAAADLSFEALVSGNCAQAFLGGFLLCGLGVPLGLEIAAPFLPKRGMMFYIFLGSLILVGAFFLRFCAIEAGVHLSLFMLGSP